MTDKPALSIEYFKFNKTHGYSIIKYYLVSILIIVSYFACSQTQIFNNNYIYTLVLDPIFGFTDTSALFLNFLIRNPSMFCVKKGQDLDTPELIETLTG